MLILLLYFTKVLKISRIETSYFNKNALIVYFFVCIFLILPKLYGELFLRGGLRHNDG